MTQSINPLDRLFRRKLKQRSMEMNPAHWESMSAMLDKAEQKKKRGAYWILGLSLSMLAVMLILFWPGTDPQVFADQKHKPKSWEKYTLNREDVSELKNENVNAQSNPILTEDLAISNPESHTDQINSDIQRKAEAHTLNEDHSTNQNQEEWISKNLITQNNHDEPSQNNATLADLSSENGNLDVRAEESHSPSEMRRNEDSHKESTDGVQQSRQRKTSEERILVKGINLLPDYPFETPMFDQNPKLTQHLSAASIDDEFAPIFKMGFYLEGMVGLGNNQNGSGGFRLGLIGQYMVSPSSIIQFEPGYHQLTGFDTYSKLRQDNIYDFGLNKEVYGMFAKTAHFISLPISYKYQYKKHGFEVGADLNYLLGVQGDVQEVTLMNIEDPVDLTRSAKINEVVESLSSGWLDMGPFTSVNARYFLGYNYMINRGFILGLRGYYQPQSILETPPSELVKPDHTKLLIGLQAKFIIE